MTLFAEELLPSSRTLDYCYTIAVELLSLDKYFDLLLTLLLAAEALFCYDPLLYPTTAAANSSLPFFTNDY